MYDILESTCNALMAFDVKKKTIHKVLYYNFTCILIHVRDLACSYYLYTKNYVTFNNLVSVWSFIGSNSSLLSLKVLLKVLFSKALKIF